MIHLAARLTIALLVLLLLPFTFLGCGPSRRHQEAAPIATALTVTCWTADDTPLELPPAEHAARVAEFLSVLREHERIFSWRCPPTPLRYYPTLSSGTPCGIPNGGGCFAALPPRGPAVYLAGSPHLGRRETLFHELLHVLLWCSTGSVDHLHADPRWRAVAAWRPE